MKKLVTILLGILLCFACFAGCAETPGGEQQGETPGGSQGELPGGNQGGNQGETPGGNQGGSQGGSQGEEPGEEPGDDKPTEPNWQEDGVLKILMVGNSFSDDTIEYVYQIAQSVGIEAELGNLFYGGCTIEQHVDFIGNSKPAYTYRTCSKATNGVWKNEPDAYGIDALEATDWDFISLQQSSKLSGKPDSYAKLDELIELVRDYNHPAATLLWNMPWADAADSTYSGHIIDEYGGDQMTQYNAYVSTIKEKILSRDDFWKIIPSGTAIQNARTAFLGLPTSLINRDGHHLTFGLGRYIAGLGMVAAITGVELTDDVWAPSSVTPDQKVLCIEAANNAAKTPLAITESILV